MFRSGSSKDRPRVVVGLDFGTTYSGFAYAETADPDGIRTFFEWPGQAQAKVRAYCKTQTSLLYEASGDGTWVFTKWGWPAHVAYSEAMKKAHKDRRVGQPVALNPAYAPRSRRTRVASATTPVAPPVTQNTTPVATVEGKLFLTKFKLHLAGSNSKQMNNWNVDPLPEGLTVDILITDYLKAIGEFILEKLRLTMIQLKKSEIQWCLTVPAIWEDEAKQKMRNCAQAAGLVTSTAIYERMPSTRPGGPGMDGEEPGSQHPLIIVLEPEAASVFCWKHTEVHSKLKKGDKFLVADVGGGTVDIVVQCKDNEGTTSLKVRQMTPSTGGLCGGSYVDKNFLGFLRKRIGCLDEILVSYPHAVSYVMSQWEDLKYDFSGEYPDGPQTLAIPSRMEKHWQSYEEDRNGSMDSTKDGEEGHYGEIEVSEADMRGIFDPVVDEIIFLIEKEMTADIKIIMVVGGFSQCVYLNDRLRRRFGESCEIVSHKDAGSAICQGAVTLGLSPDIVVSRVLRKTYGVLVTREFQPTDPESHAFRTSDGKKRCTNVFHVFVRRGQEILTNDTFSHVFYPTEHGQKELKISLYSSSADRDPAFVDEPGVHLEGSFILKMSDGWLVKKDMKRKLKVSLFFGRSTIEVTVQQGKKEPQSIPIDFEAPR